MGIIAMWKHTAMVRDEKKHRTLLCLSDRYSRSSLKMNSVPITNAMMRMVIMGYTFWD